MIMNSAKHIAARVHHRRLSSLTKRWRRVGALLGLGEDGEGVQQGRALDGGEVLGPGLEALEPGGVDAVDEVAGGRGGAHALDAPVVLVLAPLDEPALEQAVDGARRVGEGHRELLGDLLDRRLALALHEDVEQLELGHREIGLGEQRVQRPGRAGEHLAPEVQQRRRDRGGRSFRVRTACMHARKYCARAVVPQAHGECAASRRGASAPGAGYFVKGVSWSAVRTNVSFLASNA
jgi:hypothetical protein